MFCLRLSFHHRLIASRPGVVFIGVPAIHANFGRAGTVRRARPERPRPPPAAPPPVADRVGGVILVASGISLLAYWLPVLTGSSRPWAGPAGAAGAAITGFLEARRGLLVALAAALLVTAAGASWVASRRGRVTPTGDDVDVSPRR
jgi:hypothetical protein